MHLEPSNHLCMELLAGKLVLFQTMEVRFALIDAVSLFYIEGCFKLFLTFIFSR